MGDEVICSGLWAEVVASGLGDEIVGSDFGDEISGSGLGGEAVGGSDLGGEVVGSGVGSCFNVSGGFAESCLATFECKLYFNSLKLFIVLDMFKANLAFLVQLDVYDRRRIMNRLVYYHAGFSLLLGP